MFAGDSEKIRQLEERIQSLTKDLHTMQSTMHGMNQRLYIHFFYIIYLLFI